MFEECELPIPVSRLFGCNGFGDAVGSVEATAGDDIQEITFLGGCLMWNDAAICGGMIQLKIFFSVWSDVWKSCERESAMKFYVPLMCCENKDVLLLTSVHPNHCANASCDSAFTESKDAL